MRRRGPLRKRLIGDSSKKQEEPPTVKEGNELDSSIMKSCFNLTRDGDEKEMGNMIDNLERKLHKETNETEKEKLEALISKLKQSYISTSMEKAQGKREEQDSSFLQSKKLSEEHLLEIISLDLEPGKHMPQDPSFVCWYESKKLWLRKSKEAVVCDQTKNPFKLGGNRGNKPMPRNLKKTFEMRI
ncbi:hypothetical protein N9064_00900 [bacterium]|nr:hypothetical protein [bacterium]